VLSGLGAGLDPGLFFQRLALGFAELVGRHRPARAQPTILGRMAPALQGPLVQA